MAHLRALLKLIGMARIFALLGGIIVAFALHHILAEVRKDFDQARPAGAQTTQP